MHSKGRYLYSVLSLDVVCVVGICLVAWAWWLFFAGMLPLRALLPAAILKNVLRNRFHANTHVLILLMVSIRASKKFFPFLTLGLGFQHCLVYRS